MGSFSCYSVFCFKNCSTDSRLIVHRYLPSNPLFSRFASNRPASQYRFTVTGLHPRMRAASNVPTVSTVSPILLFMFICAYVSSISEEEYPVKGILQRIWHGYGRILVMPKRQKPPKAKTRLRLKVREVAEEKGISMAVLARRANIGITTAQRIWNNSATAAKGGPPLESVSLKVLEDVAEVLGVEPWDLIRWKDEENVA
jgi:hypothetical protein